MNQRTRNTIAALGLYVGLPAAYALDHYKPMQMGQLHRISAQGSLDNLVRDSQEQSHPNVMYAGFFDGLNTLLNGFVEIVLHQVGPMVRTLVVEPPKNLFDGVKDVATHIKSDPAVANALKKWQNYTDPFARELERRQESIRETQELINGKTVAFYDKVVTFGDQVTVMRPNGTLGTKFDPGKKKITYIARKVQIQGAKDALKEAEKLLDESY